MNGYEPQMARRTPAGKRRSTDFWTVPTIVTLSLAQAVQLPSLMFWTYFVGIMLIMREPLLSERMTFTDGLWFMLFVTYPAWILGGAVAAWCLFYLRMRVAAVVVAGLLTIPTIAFYLWLIVGSLGIDLARLVAMM